jgi:hypothetical protein
MLLEFEKKTNNWDPRTTDIATPEERALKLPKDPIKKTSSL